VRAELGELLLGTATGRSDDAEITIFESLGLAVEDLAAAGRAYRQALARRGRPDEIGSWLAF
jgi:ornithine cyclodeaminase/alanine dehydrogenase-like protein (mu-crystallin family)